jgi:hypothetical protein
VYLLVFYSGMALTELNFAREKVIIGFSTIFVGLAILVIVLIALNGKDIVKKLGESAADK